MSHSHDDFGISLVTRLLQSTRLCRLRPKKPVTGSKSKNRPFSDRGGWEHVPCHEMKHITQYAGEDVTNLVRFSIHEGCRTRHQLLRACSVRSGSCRPYPHNFLFGQSLILRKVLRKKRNLFRRSGTVLCSCDVVVNTLALVMCSSVVHCVRVSWYDGRDAFLSCSLMIVSSWYMSTGLVSIISSIVWNVHICTYVQGYMTYPGRQKESQEDIRHGDTRRHSVKYLVTTDLCRRVEYMR